MKLFDIVKKVGSSLIKTIIPGSGLLIDTVNEFLPDDKKLSKSATGDELNAALESLPPEQRASVLEKEFDVEIVEIKESNETLRTMLEYDTKNPQSTRPKIAYQAFQVIAATVIITMSLWAYAVATGNTKMVETIMNGWPFIVGVTSVLSTVLLSYFGSINKERQGKIDLASGSPKLGAIAGIVSMFKK